MRLCSPSRCFASCLFLLLLVSGSRSWAKDSCAESPDPAAAFITQLQELAAKMPFETTVAELAARVAPLLAANGALWRRHVLWNLDRLAREEELDLSGGTELARPLDGEALARSVTTQSERQQVALMFADPVSALFGVRSMVAQDPANGEASKRLARSQEAEAVAPPRAVWVRGDLAQPVLALVKRGEVFQVTFAFDAGLGTYWPRESAWVIPKTERGSEARHEPAADRDAVDAFGEAVARRLEGVSGSADKNSRRDGGVGNGSHDDHSSAKRAERMTEAVIVAREEAERTLVPAAAALHERARCEFRRLPKIAPLSPGAAGAPAAAAGAKATAWSVGEAPSNADAVMALGGAVSPLAHWRPRLFASGLFELLRDQRRADTGFPPRVAGVMDALAPPHMFRANDDAEAPVLVVMDSANAVTVKATFEVRTQRYVFTGVEWFKKAEAGKPSRSRPRP